MISTSLPPSRDREPGCFTRDVRIDPDTAMAIWEVRDAETGRLLRQYPSQRSVESYRQAPSTAAST